MTKQEVREQIKQRFADLTQYQMEVAKKRLLNNIKSLIDGAETIAVYNAHNKELSLDLVIEYALSVGKKLFVPISYRNDKNMLLAKYSATQKSIFSNPGSIVTDNRMKWYNLDLILLPTVAVSFDGVRIGKGGGYYDCTLANLGCEKTKPLLCGVGYSFQQYNVLPKDDWDITLNYFASDDVLIKFDV